MTVKDVETLLESAYREAKKLILLTKKLRDKDQVLKHAEVRELFESLSESWIAKHTKHIGFKNRVTHIHVGCEGHGPPELTPKMKEQLLDAVQQHLNILRNCIFDCPWNETPDYTKSARRYTDWDRSRSSAGDASPTAAAATKT